MLPVVSLALALVLSFVLSAVLPVYHHFYHRCIINCIINFVITSSSNNLFVGYDVLSPTTITCEPMCHILHFSTEAVSCECLLLFVLAVSVYFYLFIENILFQKSLSLSPTFIWPFFHILLNVLL